MHFSGLLFHSLLWVALPGLVSALIIRQGKVHSSTSDFRREPLRGKTAVLPVQYHDHHWFTNVFIGKEVFSLMIDTGSSILWVPGSNFSNSYNETTYSFAEGSSPKLLPNISFKERFVGSQVSGKVYRDIAGLNSTGARNFVFGVAENLETLWPFGGVLGMGFPQRSYKSLESYPTLFETLIPRLESPVFALDFRIRPAASKAGPSIELGGANQSKFAGKPSQVDINKMNGHWTAQNVTFGVKNQHMNESFDPLFDTGADEIISAPFSVLHRYYDGIPGLVGGLEGALRQAYALFNSSCTLVIPCNLDLPDIDLYIGNGKARIPGRFMAGRSIGNNIHPMTNNSTELCYPVLRPFFDGSETAVDQVSCPLNPQIGAPFFQTHYVVFNQEEPSISYAPYREGV